MNIIRYRPVSSSCRLFRLLLCGGVRPPPNECLRYDTNQSDGENPVIPSTGRIELNCVLKPN